MALAFSPLTKKIARNLGIEASSDFRTIAAIFHSFDEASEEGHCYLP